MSAFRFAGLSALLAVAVVSLPLLATATPEAAASARTTPIGKRLAVLKGAGTIAGDVFGFSVAISGTTAVVGAADHAGAAGRAYVFTKTTRAWKRAAELQGSNPDTGDVVGFSVAISGAAAVVGAYGHAKNIGQAYVFEA